MSKTNIRKSRRGETAKRKPGSAASGLLERIADAGLELAQYASYAEIVGGVQNNRTQIREWCDTIFELNRQRERLRSNEQAHLPPGSGGEAQKGKPNVQ